MFSLQQFLFVAIFLQSLSPSLTWIPITSPQTLQSYVIREMQELRPPSPPLLSVTQRTLHSAVDFRKPKTQTYYRTTLSEFQEPEYEFRYKVHDPKEDNYQEKMEMRVGDSVKGYYRVREPNGYIRFVKYVSDENGFYTEVSHYHADDQSEDSYTHR